MENNLSENWIFKNSITDIDQYFINGLNIWDFKWNYTNEFIYVKDPTYGQIFYKPICFIEKNSVRIYFIAFEFSPNMWGIYLKNEYAIKHIIK
jgi:hypothetical protein